MKYLVFTAEWCRPCKALHTSIQLLQKTREIDIEYVDIAADPERVARFAVRAVPTIIRLENERETARKVGQADFHDLNMFFSEVQV
jgi:thioredoxin-like negative regulator of GroEL